MSLRDLLSLFFSYDLNFEKMISNFDKIAVNLVNCSINGCHENCEKFECFLCSTCVSEIDMRTLHQAHDEHIRRRGFKRIFPSKPHFDEDSMAEMTLENQVQAAWFAAKCEENSDWC